MRLRPYLVVNAGVAAGAGAAAAMGNRGASLAAAADLCVGVHGSRVRDPRSPLDLPIVWRREGPDAALTFDDGPDPVSTPRLLETLGEVGMQATCFLIGQQAEHRSSRPRFFS